MYITRIEGGKVPHQRVHLPISNGIGSRKDRCEWSAVGWYKKECTCVNYLALCVDSNHHYNTHAPEPGLHICRKYEFSRGGGGGGGGGENDPLRHPPPK